MTVDGCAPLLEWLRAVSTFKRAGKDDAAECAASLSWLGVSSLAASCHKVAEGDQNL